MFSIPPFSSLVLAGQGAAHIEKWNYFLGETMNKHRQQGFAAVPLAVLWVGLAAMGIVINQESQSDQTSQQKTGTHHAEQVVASAKQSE
jgi:hypothetical protein